MFAYNPTVSNNAGQIYGQFQLQGAQNLAQGIGQASTGISDAIKQVNAFNMQQQVAKGALGAAQGLVDKGYMDQGTLDKLNSLPPMQQIGAAQNILPMLQAAGMMDYHKSLIDMKAQTLAQKGAASAMKTQTSKYIPGQGWVSGAPVSDNSMSDSSDSSNSGQ
jgi:hypothetical protein